MFGPWLPYCGRDCAHRRLSACSPRLVPSLESWLSDAEQVVDRLVRSRPPRHAADIHQQTCAEQDKGFCSPFYCRSALDRMFGVGQWRPLERFQVIQADQKSRMIDDARRTAHNEHTAMSETIFTVNVDFVASVASMLAQRLTPTSSDLGVLDWPRFDSGIYFDDELALEAIADHDVSQRGLRMVFQLLGAPPQPEKGFAPTANRHYLGSSIHTGDFLNLGCIRVQPRYSTRVKVLARLKALQSNRLSRDDAGKLRGDVTWLFSQSLGHLGKLAGPTLTAHQFGSEPELTENGQLHLLHDIPVWPQTHQCQLARVYTDASFEDGQLRLGWVIFGASPIPVGGTTLVPDEVLCQWKARTQQIFPGEALAALVVPHICRDVVQGRDLLWFVDNEAAVASLVRASSSELDVLFLVQQAHLQLHSLNTRVWFEWIDTESNPSDGLSRAGLDDEWTQRQGWLVHEFSFPSILAPKQLLSQLLESIGSTDSG